MNVTTRGITRFGGQIGEVTNKCAYDTEPGTLSRDVLFFLTGLAQPTRVRPDSVSARNPPLKAELLSPSSLQVTYARVHFLDEQKSEF